MTQKEAKKNMTREERKAYKAQQREGLTDYYVKIQNNTWNAKKYGYSKLVRFQKGMDLIYGVWQQVGDKFTRIKMSKHEWKVLERDV